MAKRLSTAILLVFFIGCGPTSVQHCQQRNEALVRDLLVQLEGIECRDDALACEAAVRKIFTEIAELAVRAEGIWQREGGEARPLELNGALRRELARTYEIPGVREILERAQQEALLVLAQLNREATSARTRSRVA